MAKNNTKVHNSQGKEEEYEKGEAKATGTE
jgi:hypothetical protein